jgi:hypothetical protein
MTSDAKTERDLDEVLEETFPASDAPANTVETGIIPRELESLRDKVSDNPAASRFELIVDGKTAFLSYRRTADTLTLAHTEVPKDFRGRGLGAALVEFALDRGRADGLQIVVECPFAREYLRKHPGR